MWWESWSESTTHSFCIQRNPEHQQLHKAGCEALLVLNFLFFVEILMWKDDCWKVMDLYVGLVDCFIVWLILEREKQHRKYELLVLRNKGRPSKFILVDNIELKMSGLVSCQWTIYIVTWKNSFFATSIFKSKDFMFSWRQAHFLKLLNVFWKMNCLTINIFQNIYLLYNYLFFLL